MISQSIKTVYPLTNQIPIIEPCSPTQNLVLQWPHLFYYKTLMQNCPSELYHIKPVMVDAIVYKHEPYGLVFIHDKSLIYHIKHERVYVSYNLLL